jgi:DNA-binding response OmpR family regulator
LCGHAGGNRHNDRRSQNDPHENTDWNARIHALDPPSHEMMLQNRNDPIHTVQYDDCGDMEKILVIEDDRATRKALIQLFESEGFAVEPAEDGAAGLAAFRTSPPDFVVLDLKLPKVRGQDVCKEIRQFSGEIPIIVLSGASDVIDRVVLLEMGADDFVTKPFSPKELLARVRTVLRRTRRPVQEQVFAFGTVVVDFKKMEAKRNGHDVSLTAQEFKILKYFSHNRSRVISRDELLNEVWGYESYPSTRTVDAHILTLRQKLESDPAKPVHFLTVHRAGYKFVV